jgi:WD40 repeat protein
MLASGSWDKTVRLWNLASGRVKAELKGHRDKVSAVAFVDDGTLMSAGWDGAIRLWDVATLTCRKTIPSGDVSCAALSPDGKTVASAGWNGFIELWDAHTGAALNPRQGHRRAITSVAYSPDGKMIATGSEDLTLRLWDSLTGRNLLILA